MFNPEKLKLMRESLGLSQEDMMVEMSKSGVRFSRQTLYNWEKGKNPPGINDLSQIALFFKKPIQYFMED